MEEHFKRPVILINYPKDIKAFYMKQNDDGKTVRAMDVLFPGIGEIIGGSEREADYGKLHARVAELGMNEKELWWYLDTRRWGSAPHSGFGLGFDRLLLFVTGMTNIRDVQPFPRTPQHADFDESRPSAAPSGLPSPSATATYLSVLLPRPTSRNPESVRPERLSKTLKPDK